MSCSIV